MTLPNDLVSDKVTKFINRIITKRPLNCSPVIKFSSDEIGRGMHVPEVTDKIFGGSKYTKKELALYLSESCSLLVDLPSSQVSTTPSECTTVSKVPLSEQWWRRSDDEETSLRKELAEAHRRVIDLQDQVIKLKDEIRNVETATVTKNCTT